RAPDRVGGEAGRQRAQRGVEVDRQVVVGAGRPAVVGGPAGGEGGPPDRQRVQRVGGLAEAQAGEVADRALPGLVVLGGAERQGGNGGDQVHPHPHLRYVVGVVVVGRHHRAADRVHQRYV